MNRIRSLEALLVLSCLSCTCGSAQSESETTPPSQETESSGEMTPTEQGAELSQEQIDQAHGDPETELPQGLKRPEHWTSGREGEVGAGPSSGADDPD